MTPGFHAKTGGSFEATINSAFGEASDAWQIVLFSYNESGDVKQKIIFSDDVENPMEITYEYNLRNQVTKKVVRQGSYELYNWYEFDDLGNLTETYLSTVDDYTSASLADVEYTYNPEGMPNHVGYGKEPIMVTLRWM